MMMVQGFPAIASIIAPWHAWHCNLLADSCLPDKEGEVVLPAGMNREECDINRSRLTMAERILSTTKAFAGGRRAQVGTWRYDGI